MKMIFVFLMLFSLRTLASEKFEVTGKVISFYQTEIHAESLMWAEAFEICAKNNLSPLKESETVFERNNAFTTATATFICSDLSGF